MAISVRPHVYRGTSGFSVTGRAHPGEFSVSIFVHCRSAAVRIKKALKATPPNPSDAEWRARNKKVDRLIEADARVKVCRR